MAEEAVKELPALLGVSGVLEGAGAEGAGGAGPATPLMVKAGEYEMGWVLAMSE